MVALFKDRSPVAIIWLVLLSIVVHSQLILFLPVVKAGNEDGVFSILLNRYLSALNPVIVICLYHLIVIGQALRLNFLFSDHKMYSRPNYLAAMAYILLTGIFPEWSALTPALLDNILVIWLFAETVKLYNANNPKSLIFNIGLLIGVSVILYQPSALLILIAFFALLVVRPFVVTELFILMMSIITPFYFLFSWLYLTDRFPSISRYIPNWQLNLPDTSPTPVFFITVGLILIILFIGLFYWQSESRRLLIHVRKNWIVLLVMLLIMLPIPFINERAGIDSLLLWAVPASPFIAKGFLAPKRNVLPNIMFWSLLLLALVKNWQIAE